MIRAAKVARTRRYYAHPSKGVPFAALGTSLHNARDRPGEEQVTLLFVPRRIAQPWPRPVGKALIRVMARSALDLDQSQSGGRFIVLPRLDVRGVIASRTQIKGDEEIVGKNEV